MNIKTLTLTILAMGSACALPNEIAVHAPSDWGNVKMRRSGSDFKLLINDQENRVEDYMVDPMLRKMNPEQTAAFLKSGYVSAKRMSNGAYKLEAKGRIKGGGPVTAAVLYWGTKVLCYGGAAATAGAVVVGTGGTALAVASGGAATVAGGVIAGAAGPAVVAGVTAEFAAGVVAGGLAAGAMEGATLVTAATITSAGGVAGAIAAVESASLGAMAFGMMLPLP